MDTRQKLDTALKDAMRANNDTARRTLRMVMAAIKFAQVENRSDLDEQAVLAILQKEIKSRRESVADAQRANRPDLISEGEAEIQVLEAFLPKQMAEDELVALARQAAAEADAKNPSDMGKVMKILMPRVQGRAPGDQVSKAVRQVLQNG
jgi:uncharacterized protein YqeY